MPSNDRLAEAMRIVAADDTPAHRADLYEAMLAADLLVLTRRPRRRPGRAARAGRGGRAGDDRRRRDRRPRVGRVHQRAGDPALRSAGRVLPRHARPRAVRHGRRRGRRRVVIDHGSPTHGILGPAEVAALARGHLPTEDGEIVRAASEVRAGVPSEPLAPDVVAAVRAALAAERHADAAWLFVLHQPPADPQLVVAVALDEALDDDARAAAMRAVVTHAGEQAPGARVLGFVAAEADLRGQLDGGGAIELYRR
ncbi:MAG: hypothetical protein R2699_17575 [Acidimicrobiales bacterium]